MHNNWEELIPFYIAGTLAKPETTHLENHLAHCDECRKSLDEWRSIASVVRADAASQLSVLPPLSAQVLRSATQQAASRSYQSSGIALLPQKPPTRASATSITLIAAVFTVIFFGGLVTFMVLRGTRQPDAANTVLLPTSTATLTPSEIPSLTPQPQIIIIEPSITPTPIASPTLVVPTFVIPTHIPPTRIIPTRLPPTSVPPPILPSALPSDAPLQFSLLNTQANPQATATCTLHAAIPNTIVNLYAGPGTNYAVVKTFANDDQLTALGKSDNGWYRAQYQPDNNQWIGWVRQELVYTSGTCDSLPLIASSDYQTNGAISATATSPDTAASATPSAIPPIVDAPAVIVSADGVNLRSGPGTNYPIVDSASLGESYHVEAESTNQNQIWYLITIPGARSAWVFGDLVQLSPANALIAPALTIPPSPSPTPTATDLPSPTPLPTTSITSGTWSQTSTVLSASCAETVGTSITTPVTLVASGDTISMSYSDAGTPFTLVRGGAQTYAGGYTTPNTSVSISLTFTSATSYSGTQIVTQNDGCIVQSAWYGVAS